MNDDDDMFIYATSLPHAKNKMHWSSRDGTILFNHETPHNINPLNLPCQKPNPNQQVLRKFSNIDIRKYFGFQTLKSLKPF